MRASSNLDLVEIHSLQRDLEVNLDQVLPKNQPMGLVRASNFLLTITPRSLQH